MRDDGAPRGRLIGPQVRMARQVAAEAENRTRDRVADMERELRGVIRDMEALEGAPPFLMDISPRASRVRSQGPSCPPALFHGRSLARLHPRGLLLRSRPVRCLQAPCPWCCAEETKRERARREEREDENASLREELAAMRSEFESLSRDGRVLAEQVAGKGDDLSHRREAPGAAESRESPLRCPGQIPSVVSRARAMPTANRYAHLPTDRANNSDPSPTPP